MGSPHKGPVMWKIFLCHDVIMRWNEMTWVVVILKIWNKSTVYSRRSHVASWHRRRPPGGRGQSLPRSAGQGVRTMFRWRQKTEQACLLGDLTGFDVKWERIAAADRKKWPHPRQIISAVWPQNQRRRSSFEEFASHYLLRKCPMLTLPRTGWCYHHALWLWRCEPVDSKKSLSQTSFFFPHDNSLQGVTRM